MKTDYIIIMSEESVKSLLLNYINSLVVKVNEKIENGEIIKGKRPFIKICINPHFRTKKFISCSFSRQKLEEEAYQF